VETVNGAFGDFGKSPTGKLLVSRNLPEPSEHSATETAPRRRRVALIFADIVESTELLARVGDDRWLTLLNSYYLLVQRELSRFHGWYLSAAGDGFLAAFDHCIHATRCSAAIRSGAHALGLRIRIGVHSGECIAFGGFLTGLTLHIGARIAAVAGADEILVSDYVRAHLDDREIEFVECGTHRLKGVPGEWRLFANRTAERAVRE
jgi:class 3 adenylate cyclase